jgi:hypothetical protein
MTAILEKNQIIDKQMLKDAILELMREDKTFFKKVAQIVMDQQDKELSIQDTDDEDTKFEAFSRRNFDRYEKTFKALA